MTSSSLPILHTTFSSLISLVMWKEKTRWWKTKTQMIFMMFTCECMQWRTQKIFMGGSFSGIWWRFLFGVRCLWRHNLTSYSCFQTNVLGRFVDIICIFLYTHSPYFMYHCTENKLSMLQARISEETTIIATTQQFITAKISGCPLKQGSKTHSWLRQISPFAKIFEKCFYNHLNNFFQAFNCWTRPVTRGSEDPLRKFFSPVEKFVRHYLKLLDIVQKISAPQKTLCPSWCPKLVMGLYWINETERSGCLCRTTSEGKWTLDLIDGGSCWWRHGASALGVSAKDSPPFHVHGSRFYVSLSVMFSFLLSLAVFCSHAVVVLLPVVMNWW